MDKILLIVDPQVDFISGSLAVEGAKEKMDALASALQNGEIDCDYVMVTKDFHPSNHCSFKENGGQWPPHCVKGTTGSCIYAPLWSVICNYAYRKDTDIFIKGDSPDKEEYSIFDNLESLSVISDILLDFDPIQDLWKTEVYELAKWISNRYKNIEHHHTIMTGAGSKSDAIELSIALTPTDGLGISNSDLEQIGAKSYDEVDDILSRYIPFKEYRQKHGEPLHPHDEMAESDCWSQLCARHGEDVVNKVWSRHLASEFKRKKAPIYISRELYE